MKLTEHQLRFYATFGFLKFPGLLNDKIGDVTDAFERVWIESGLTHDFNRTSALVPFAESNEYLSLLLEDPRIDGVVSSILGDDYNYYTSNGSYYVGDTDWHSDHQTNWPYHSLKIGLYLDPTRRDAGGLRVIPGSCHHGDYYTSLLDPVHEFPKGARSDNIWGVHGSDLPAQDLESEPGDMLLFNHKIKHSSWGGGDRRRMLTYDFEQRVPDNLLSSLRDLLKGPIERGDAQAYGETLLRVATPQYRTHLEQRIVVWDEMVNEC